MKRPTAVTVFSVLNILWGAWAIIVLLMAGVGLAVMAFALNSGGPAAAAFQSPIFNEPLPAGWLIFSIIAGSIVGAVQLAAGIKMLQLRPWARKASNYCAIYSLAMLVVNIPFQIYVGSFNTTQVPAGTIPPVVMQVFSYAMTALTILFFAGYYGSMLYFLSRPHVVAAFAASETGQLITQPASIEAAVVAEPASQPDEATPLPVESAPVETPKALEPLTPELLATPNAPAMASFYLGVSSLYCTFGMLLSLAAIYYGIVGLMKVHRRETAHGQGYAWAGIICAILFGFANLAGTCYAMLIGAMLWSTIP